MRKFAFAISSAIILSIMSSLPAMCWTAVVNINAPDETGCSVPAIARGSGGKIYVVYRRKNPDWRLLFRERSGAGIWGPVQAISVPWSERADICEDPQGNPRIVYEGTIVSGGKTDILETYRVGGTWYTNNLTNTVNDDEGYPKISADPLGNLHLVYARGSNIYYRKNTGSGWSGETHIGTCGSTYYHRPDMAVDSLGNVHVTWLNNTNFYYRKFNGSSWGSTLTIGTTTSDKFFAYGKVTAPTPSLIVAVTFDQHSNAVLKTTYSTNGGASWSSFVYFSDGHYPNLTSDTSGGAHLTYQASGGKPIAYRYWTGTGWSAQQNTNPATVWQGWSDIAVDTNGIVHIAFDNSEQLGYLNSAVDNIPPLQVTNFSALASDGAVTLSWKNPSDPDFQATVIRAKTTGYPTGPNDGTLVCNRAAAPGSNDSFMHSGLVNGTTYYYAAYAYDFVPNYSAATTVTGQPQAVTCASAKQQADGQWTSMTGKIVSAVFPGDTAIYVQEPDRSSGIRVVNSGSGLAVGDVVNVSGTMATRILNSVNSERQIASATVTKTSAGTPPIPLGVNCKTFGGADNGLQKGVKDGIGLNNIGLLVAVYGKVTYASGQYIFVDDGSNIENIWGISTPTTGIMIKGPTSTTAYPAGSYVKAVGVAMGSVPNGWTQNRRYMQVRNWSDVSVLAGP